MLWCDATTGERAVFLPKMRAPYARNQGQNNTGMDSEEWFGIRAGEADAVFFVHVEEGEVRGGTVDEVAACLAPPMGRDHGITYFGYHGLPFQQSTKDLAEGSPALWAELVRTTRKADLRRALMAAVA